MVSTAARDHACARVNARGGAWDEQAARDCTIARDSIPQFRADDQAADALAALSRTSVDRRIVLENGRLVGIISIADLARALEARPPTMRPRPAQRAR
jgi:CBS domain-containing protein